MPLVRKQQIQAVQESSEGLEPTFTAADAVQVFEPNMSDDPDVQKQTPSGPSLSRGMSTIGRKDRTFTFKTHFRGSGDTTLPITEPDWARFGRACGYKTSNLRKITLGAVTGTGFQVGEQVSQGANVGVIVGAFTSGGALTHRLASSGGHIVVVPLGSGTFTTAATTGASSGSTSTATAEAAYEGFGLQTTSEKLMVVQTGAWSAGAPAALYETLAIEDATTGVVLGAVQVVVDNSAGAYTNIDVTLLWGAIANGNKLRTASGSSTATISTAPVQTKTTSLALRRNFDGRRKTMLGARGDFTLEGDAGRLMEFAWTFNGDPTATVDAAPVVTSGLSQITAPRLLGAICAYGKGSEIYRLPTKSVSLSNGGTVSPNLDANREGGSTGSNITDRDPALAITTDNVGSSFDWELARDSVTPIRAAILLGTTKGNIMGIIAPRCQVTVATEADAEGVSAFDVTLEPKGVAESGDDDIYLVQL